MIPKNIDNFLNKIDFKKIDWRKFQYLCADLLTAEGFINVFVGGEGQDRGRDISAEEDISSHTGFKERIKWMVQCKHYAGSGRSVRANEISEIQDYLEEHNADGLFIITDSTLSSSAVLKIEKFNDTKKHPYRARFWEKRQLINKLLTNEKILTKYFGESNPFIKWEHFKFAKLEFIISAKEILYLSPYKTSTLRGGFGYVFKNKVCIEAEKQCTCCILRGNCIYFNVFEAFPFTNGNTKKKPYFSRALIIETPIDDKQSYDEGEDIKFTLILIGKAINSIPYIITTFDELGKAGIGKSKGRYVLKEVNCFKNNNIIPLYNENKQIIANNIPLITIYDVLDEYQKYQDIDKININFLTPTRIKYQGKWTANLDFSIFISSILRRILLLSKHACGETLALNWKELIEKSKKVIVIKSNLKWHSDWQRHSTRQNKSIALSGFIGNINFCGDLNDFMIFIILGSYLHIGKGTIFGQGKYMYF